MKLLWIGAEANKPAAAAFTLPLQKVPSLVALAMAEKPQGFSVRKFPFVFFLLKVPS